MVMKSFPLACHLLLNLQRMLVVAAYHDNQVVRKQTF